MQDLLDTIKQKPWYRGQAQHALDMESESAVYSREENDTFESQFIRQAFSKTHKNEQLYLHQTDVIDAWLNNSSFLMAAPSGSGRRTMIALLSLCSVIARGQRSLIITSDDAKAKDIYQRVEMLGKQTNTEFALYSSCCLDENAVTTAIEKGCGLIVVPASVFFKTLHSYGAGTLIGTWLRSLATVFIFSLSLFTPPELCHIRALCAFITIYSKDCVFGMFSLEVDSPEVLLTDLLPPGISQKVISNDVSKKSAYKMMYWHSPLTAIPRGDPGSYEIIRANYFEETLELVSEISKDSQCHKILFWCAKIDFSRAQLRQLKTKIIQKIRHLPESPNITPTTIDLIESLENCPVHNFRKYDLVIMLGIPGGRESYLSPLGNLLKENGNVIAIIPEDPISYGQFRQEELANYLPGRKVVYIPKSDDVGLEYIDRIITASPPPIPLSILHSIISEKQVTAMIRNHQLVQVSETKYQLLKKSKSSPIEWGQLTNDIFTFDFRGSHKFRIDSYLFPHIYHNGGTITYDDNIYKLDSFNNTATLLGDDSFAKPIPMIKNSIEFSGNVIKQKKFSSERNSHTLYISECNVLSKELGYWLREDYSSLNATKEIKHEPIKKREWTAQALIIKTENPKEMAILAWLYFNYYLSHCEEMLTFEYTDNGIAIIPLHHAFNDLALEIYSRIDVWYNSLFSFSFHLLKACACISGCQRCLLPASRKLRTDVSKENITKYVSSIINIKNADQDWQYRAKGLEPEQAQSRYEWERELILRLFSNRFDLMIGSKVPIVAVATLDGPVGIYTHSEVKIIAPLKEATALQVIAHEYAHNWEFDPSNTNMSGAVMGDGIPFNGKLVSEGFAEWVAFKVCDHLGLIDEAKEIDLRTGDEYGDGFDFLNWIELTKKGGYAGVIELVKTGKLKRSEDTFQTILELIKEFKLSPTT